MTFQKALLYLTSPILISISCYSTDQLSIYNHTNSPIFASIYYVVTNNNGISVGPAQRITPVVTISANSKATVERPSRQSRLNRELLVSLQREELQPALERTNWQPLCKIKAGSLDGSTFHIALKYANVKAYDNASWTIKNLGNFVTGKLTSLKEEYCHHPYAQYTATLRTDNTICYQELDFKEKRLEQARDTLEQLFGIKMLDSETPCIAVSLSGGGMRATMCSYAIMEALQDLKLVNALTYITALSGSTWFLANWLMSGLDIKSYKDVLMTSLIKPQLFRPATLATQLWPKYLFGQHTSIVDLYGVYLANTFCNYAGTDESRQQITLSMLQTRIGNGDVPFPLFTAGETTTAFNWCTFTPYEFSCDALHYTIPVWAFGRRFREGKSIDIAPEASLGFMMGLWGSALSGSLEEMLEEMAGSLDPRLFNALSSILADVGANEVRLAAIKVCNPLYHIPNAPFTKNKHLIFVDGGYGYNVPLLPLFHPQRKADIIFILDVSESILNNALDLRKAEKHLLSLGIQLPVIDYNRALSQPITIFSDPHNPNAPTIIYVAPIKNDRYDKHFDPKHEIKTTYPAARFIYNPQDIDKLTGLIRFNILDSSKLIFNAIEEKIKMKKKIQTA